MTERDSSSKQRLPAVYVASRASNPARPAMWRKLRDEFGFKIISSWIDEAGDGETADFAELWKRITAEIARCDMLVFYAHADDFPLKGALIEVGMALAMQKPVWVFGNLTLEGRTDRPLGSWIRHPLVHGINVNCKVSDIADVMGKVERGSDETPEPRNMHSDEWWQTELDRCVGIEQAKYRALFDAYVELKAGDPEVTAGVRPAVEPTPKPECPKSSDGWHYWQGQGTAYGACVACGKAHSSNERIALEHGIKDWYRGPTPEKASAPQPVRWKIKDGPRAGTIVYPGRDSYGCANDDTRNSGVEHVAVCDNESGNPFYTIPKRDLEAL